MHGKGGFVAGIWEEGAGRAMEQGGSVVTALPLVQSAPLFLVGESLAVAHQEKPEKRPAREHGHSPAWMRPRGESSSWETGLGVKGGGPQGDAPGVWALTRLESSGSGPWCCSAASSLPAIGEERRRKEKEGGKGEENPAKPRQRIAKPSGWAPAAPGGARRCALLLAPGQPRAPVRGPRSCTSPGRSPGSCVSPEGDSRAVLGAVGPCGVSTGATSPRGPRGWDAEGGRSLMRAWLLAWQDRVVLALGTVVSPRHRVRQTEPLLGSPTEPPVSIPIPGLWHRGACTQPQGRGRFLLPLLERDLTLLLSTA